MIHVVICVVCIALQESRMQVNWLGLLLTHFNAFKEHFCCAFACAGIPLYNGDHVHPH